MFDAQARRIASAPREFAQRASIHGLTLVAGAAHLVRAALEAVADQTRDLLDAMIADGATRPAAIRVDGCVAQRQ